MKKTKPESTWKCPDTHYLEVIGNEWYKDINILLNQIIHSTYNFFLEEEVLSVCVPVTASSCTSPMGLGSDSLPVKVNIDGIDTFLADSMQFHLEYLLRVLDSDVHYLMPTFRGEKADKRHLCQFYHSEAEIKGDLKKVMSLVGKYLNRLCTDIITNNSAIITKYAGTLEHIEKIISLQGNYPIISLEEAVEILDCNPEYIEVSPFGFKQVTNKGESKLIEKYNGIIWLINHDWLSVPFYQARQGDSKYSKNADLLFGIGEVVGAGERCETISEIKESLDFHGVNAEEYDWYIKMKEKYPIKTSGFGMGVERFLLFLLKHDDIRDVQTILRFNGENIKP